MNSARKLLRAIASVALMVTAVLSLSACASSSNSKYFSFTSKTTLGKLIPVSQRKPARNVGGELVGGGKTSLAKYKGKVTLLNFFGAWCPPCRLETPQLALLAKRDPSVAFVGVDLADRMSAIKPFLAQSKVDYPVIFDQPERIPLTLDLPVKGVPFTVLIDKSGRVAAVYITTLTPKDLARPLAELAQQS